MGTVTEIAHGDESRCMTNMEDSRESDRSTASKEDIWKFKVDEV